MKIKLIIAFLIIIAIVASLLEYEKSKKIEKYIQHKAKEHQAMYDAIYHSFKKRADIASTFIMQDKNILALYEKLQDATSTTQKALLREELYQIITHKYKVLEQQGIYILHFHLHNNESFFRMHKPSSFGENLTNKRRTIAYVNKHEKSIHGFEVGKYFSGYRFIYPLISPLNEHLGSFEISFDLGLYVQEFMTTLDVLSNFRIKKEIIDEKCDKDEVKHCYVNSILPDYYAPKNVIELLDTNKRKELKKLVVDTTTLNKGVSFTNKGKAVAVFDDKSKNLITFIPVKNPVSQKVCGFITIRSDDKYIYNKRLNTYFILGLFSIFIFLGMIFIYRQIQSQKELNKLLQEEVDKKTKELQDINENLEFKVKEEVDKNIIHELKILKQTKQAALGDMIGNIAHQWRQPLSIMSSVASGIKMKQEFGMLDKETIGEGMDSIIIKTQYLSETVETFRNYLKEKKEKREVVLQDRINLAMAITKTALRDNHIELKNNIDEIEPIKIKLVAGELSEVLINLINNAKDVLLEREIKEPWIEIKLSKQKDQILITIEDNGGGIRKEVFPKIFDQYFTTKDDSKGTGLGLHMSKKIIEESIKGKLYVQNTKSGAKFFIELPLKE